MNAFLCYHRLGCPTYCTTGSCGKGKECTWEVYLTDPGVVTVYTVGHSNHEANAFVGLLRQHSIELVVDVRSTPYSRYVPQANRESLARTLESAGIAYRWLGDLLGGKPEGATSDYDEIRASPAFQQGVRRLLDLAATDRTVIMCSEGDHRQCHRHLLITQTLLNMGVYVGHIQPDGTCSAGTLEPEQLTLFG